MTSYYSQGSVKIYFTTEEERFFLTDALRKAITGEVDEEDELNSREGESFNYETVEATPFEYGHLAIFSDESFNLDPIVDIVVAFQLYFDKTEDYWIGEVAYTCSKMMAGTFGGAGCLVHRGIPHWLTPGEYFERLTDKLLAARDFEATLPTYL